MGRLNHARAKNSLPCVKPCDIFDLIGGTSTGGLIAIMLGLLEMDVDACIRAYSDLAVVVFGEKLSSILVNFKGDIRPRFDSAKLEGAIRKVVHDSGISDQDLLDDGAERGCRTFVCTVDRYTKNVVRLRSYSLLHEWNVPATICQAALATCATTTLFEPISIGARSFADGELGANNPVDEVEGEASNIWCSETGDLKPLVKCFISIGTGNLGQKPVQDGIFQFFEQTVWQIANETENTERRFIARWARHFDDKRYFRLNVEQGLQEIGLEEYKKKGAIEAATESYLTHTAQKFRVRDCIQNLELKQDKPDVSFATVVHDYIIRDIQSKSAPYLTSWVVPFERNHLFTGREHQLAQLEGMLFAKDRTAKIAIMGLGGIGKTQLVLELLFRTKDKYPGCSIIWIPATNKESLHQAYLDAVQQLDIPEWKNDKQDVKQLLQSYLSKESTGRWLLVYDNADDIDMWIAKPISGLHDGQAIQPLIDYLPKSKQGTILFTTRDRKLAVKLAQQNIVDVPAMREGVAAQLLEKSLVGLNINNSGQDTRALLSQLTYLPLAIVQAAAYINENGITIADYLSLLADQEDEVIDLLSEEFETEGRYRDVKNPVATTWLISFEQIRQRDPLAAEYLSFMACIEPKDIPLFILPPGSTRKEEMNAIGTLNAYSFISRRPTDMALDLHRLVHLATRNWLRNEERLVQSTEKSIMWLEEAFPSTSHENRRLWRTYLTHVCCVLGSDLVNKNWDTRASLMHRYALCLVKDGRWDEAEVLITQVFDIRKRTLGANHTSTLRSMNSLAMVYQCQERWNDAEELLMHLIKIRKRIEGEEHPNTLNSNRHLVVVYMKQGRWNEAEELQNQVIEIELRDLGAEHPGTLISQANMGSIYRNQGRWDAAEELEEQVLKTRQRVLGLEHPQTLKLMDNLASTYNKKGRLQEAEELRVHVLEAHMKILGADHPTTLKSMGKVASAYELRGKLDKAEALRVKVLETRTKTLGVHHPKTVDVLGRLAWTYHAQGRLDEAEALEVQVLETSRRILGVAHSDTLDSMFHLASIYRDQGRAGEAEVLEVQLKEYKEDEEHTGLEEDEDQAEDEEQKELLGANCVDGLNDMASVTMTDRSKAD